MFSHLKQVLKDKSQICQCHSDAVVLAAQGVHCRRDLSNAGPMGVLPKFLRLYLMASLPLPKNSFAQITYVSTSPAGYITYRNDFMVPLFCSVMDI